MQYIQNLLIFKSTALVKTNIPTLLKKSVFKWYTFELSEFDHDVLNNNLGMKN